MGSGDYVDWRVANRSERKSARQSARDREPLRQAGWRVRAPEENE